MPARPDQAPPVRSLVRRACVAGVLAFLGFPLGAAQATLPPLSSTTIAGVRSLVSVACPSVTQCTSIGSVVSPVGSDIPNEVQEITFNPASPNSSTAATVETGQYLFGGDIACLSLTLCTAIDESAHELTFDPALPGSPIPANYGAPLPNLACPSTTQCTAVGPDPGGVFSPKQEVTFDPAAPGSPTPVTFNPDSGYLNAVSCPSVTECVAVGWTGVEGQEITFDPTSLGSPTPVTLGIGLGLYGVACPLVTQCTAVGGASHGAVEITFNPLAPGTSIQAAFTGGLGPDSVVCPSATQCTAWDSQLVATFNPTAPGSPAATAIDADQTITSIACPSITQCTAVGGQLSAGAFTGVEVTFDPVQPPSADYAASPSLEGDVASVELACGGLVGQECTGAITARTVEELAGHGKTVVGVSADRPRHGRWRKVLVGQTSFTGSEGQSQTVRLTLNAAGRELLRRFKRVRAKLTITTDANGIASSAVTTIVTFAAKNVKNVVVRG
jgi:hypothetical protein